MYICMKERFEVLFLERADEFLEEIDEKAKIKLLYNLKLAKTINDPKIFKKLDSDIWELRANSKGVQYRLLAFWDKRTAENTLVVCSHGFIKKTDKLPVRELDKARKIMVNYFQNQ